MNRGLVAGLVCLAGFSAFSSEFQPVDLSRFIDRPLSSYKPNESWAAPPRGLQTFEDVQFEIVGKIELTGLGSARDGKFHPPRVMGIPVGRKAARLHVLHAAGYADQDGTPIVQLVMNYPDGERHAMPLAYGVHTRNWYVERNEKTSAITDTNTVVAWRGSCPDTDRFGVTLRLFKTVFPNPRPEMEIKSIDLVSLFSRATPVIVAMSTEGGAATPSLPVKKFDDSPYRRELTVRLDPPTAAVINVSATDASRTYKFGSYTNDAKAPVVIDYAPQMKRVQLAVNTSEFLPAITNIEKEFPKELVVKLQRGNSIGGFVRTRTGQPIKDAEVIVSQVTEDADGQFVETDLAWVKTDAEGRWTISSIVGTNFTKMNFAARHSEFLPGDFQQFNDPQGKLSTEALLAGKAVLELAKGATISGTVVDAETGKAIPEFKMVPGKRLQFFLRDELRWDRDNSFAAWDGKFTFQLSEEDAQPPFGLAIEAPGYLPEASPRYTNAGNYTHHFKLKKGREGIRGLAQAPDGKPIAGLKLYLVDSTERVYMHEPGEIKEPSSRNASIAISDPEGRFVFEPRLEPNTIIAAHRLGYAETPANQAAQLKLQPWAAVKGVLRVGAKVETNHLVSLQSMEYQLGDGQRFWQPLALDLIVSPEGSGEFAFTKVPPGERRIALRYTERIFPQARTHGFAIDVKPGETNEVTIGGTGRHVVGKMMANGNVDWTRDIHWFIRKHPEEPSSRRFADVRAFWTSATGRAFEREAFRFVPVFRADGSFRIDDVPAGEYVLMIRPTDPNTPEENRLIARPMGEFKTNVVVRENVVDLSVLELKFKR